MPFIQGDPVTQDQRYASFVEDDKKTKEAQQKLGKDVADRVAQIYKDAPYIPASVILSLAKSGTSPETVEAIKKTAAKTTAAQLDPQKPKKKSWWQEAIYDNVKAASRWTFAGLSFVPDMVQNAASQVFNDPNPNNIDGWFKSTQLGTLMSNTQEAGEGFFIGEKALEKQGERARRFRGEINGHAWTVGRGAAELAFTPGSKPYAVLSGFVDAAVNLGTDPTLPVGKSLQATKLARATLPGLATAEEIANAAKLAKGAAGLDDAEGIAFQASKFGKWAVNDPRAKNLTRRIVEVASDTGKEEWEKTLFMLENIDGLDPVTASAFANADTEGKVLGLLGTASARLTTNPADVLLPTDIRDIKLAKGFDWTRSLDDTVKERVGLYRTFRGKWLQTMPKGSVVITGTGADKKQSILNYARYLRGGGFGDDTQEFKDIMTRVVAAYSSDDPVQARAGAKDAYDFMIQTVFDSVGGKSAATRQAADELIKAVADARARIFQPLDQLGNLDDGGALQMLRAALPEDVFDDIPIDVQDRLVIAGPGALNELADDVEILPDFRRLRALAGHPWLTRNAAGGKRGAAVMAEFLQQDIWKPLALATGGYIMRNMIDAQTRIAMSGKSGLFRHPQDFILWVTRRKGRFDITGNDFGDIKIFKQTANTWNKEQDEFWQALTFDIHKNLKDPYQAEYNLYRNGNFSIADISNKEAHTVGYVDNLALINDDTILSRVARLSLEGLDQPTRTLRIKDFLQAPENKELLGQLRDYFQQGVKYTDPQTGNIGYLKAPTENFDDFVDAWVERLSEIKVGSIVRDNEDLRVVAAYNKVPLLEETTPGKFVASGPRQININDVTPSDILEGDGGVGSIVRLEDDVEGVIIRAVDTPTGIDPMTGLPSSRQDYLVQPVYPGSAFTKDGLGSQNLRNLLDSLRQEGKLAKQVKVAQRGTGDGTEQFDAFRRAKDKFVDAFFVRVYGVLTQKLEKSPVFRQAYYQEVFNNADLLAPAEATALIARATASADDVGMTVANYVGGKKVLARLQEIAAQEISYANISTNEQYVKFGNTWRTKFLKKRNFSNQELDSISKYTGGGYHYRAIQDMLRGGDVAQYLDNDQILEIKDVVSGVDSIIKSSDPIEEAVTTFRAIVAEETGNKSFVYQWINSEVGDIISDSAFSSSTFDEEYAVRRANRTSNSVVLEILNPPGTKGIDPLAVRTPLDANGLTFVEKEWLLPRNTKFRVVEKTENRIKVQVVGKDIQESAIGTLEQLDEFAKASALRQTKELLYNATERSNLEDVMRIVVPFGSAWKEVLGTYAKNVVEDPTRLRKAQLIFDGARKFDPDGDGQGFFYRDATTGEYSFNFPLSGQLTKLLTGQEVPLQAPVKRLSIGLGVVPSIGPMAQIAASEIIPDTPSTDAIVSVLLPYGRKEGFGVTPIWAKRLKEVWDANTQNLQTVYGNTYIETMRALSASGEYDLSDPNEQQQLFADAKQKARIIASLRALGQFIGPTSPSPEFKIDTIAGDFYGTQLVKEFQKLQANNYDTAVSEFLRIYGNDALLYISNKTEAVAGGLEATDDFGDWERGDGKGLINEYPDVAGFMAPGGDNFSFEVWSRQLTKGRRRRLTDREIVELAQYRAASAQYRALRDKLPPRPTSEQKRWLRQWRVKLNQEYPGFPVVAEFNPGEFPKQLEQLGRLVADDRLADNDVADATRQYLAARDAAVQRYVQAGGAAGGFSTAVVAAPLRDWLANVGRALKEETPEFARLYERLLSNEVEE